MGDKSASEDFGTKDPPIKSILIGCIATFQPGLSSIFIFQVVVASSRQCTTDGGWKPLMHDRWRLEATTTGSHHLSFLKML